MNEQTIEQVKSDLAAVDTSAFDATIPVMRGVGASAGGLSPEQFAAYYPAVRNVLVALSTMFFTPPRLKVILDTLVTYLDALTGTK